MNTTDWRSFFFKDGNIEMAKAYIGRAILSRQSMTKTSNGDDDESNNELAQEGRHEYKASLAHYQAMLEALPSPRQPSSMGDLLDVTSAPECPASSITPESVSMKSEDNERKSVNGINNINNINNINITSITGNSAISDTTESVMSRLATILTSTMVLVAIVSMIFGILIAKIL